MSASAASWKTTFSAIMQRLKRDAGCIYFKQPVDPVALQIPLYPYIIKHPVDLGTIERRLQADEYASAGDAAVDVIRCFSNAMMFNGPASVGSEVYKAARSMRGLFCRQYRSKFHEEPPSASFDTISPPADAAPRPEEDLELTSNGVAVLQAMLTRMKAKYDKALAPFIFCVDPVKHPEYYEVIQHPMALSLVEAKLELYAYARVSDFATEVRQIWRNCATFNDPGAKLARQAVKLASKFEKYLEKAISEIRNPPPSPIVNIVDRSAAAAAVAPPPELDLTVKLALPPPPPFNKAICISIVNKLQKDKRSPAFREPVPEGVIGYRDVVSHPMDLRTVRNRITSGHYKSNDEFVSDIRLIWRNCRLFNGPSAPITELANALSSKFENDLLPELGISPKAEPDVGSPADVVPPIAKLTETAEVVEPEPAESVGDTDEAEISPDASATMTRGSKRRCARLLRELCSLEMAMDFRDPLDPVMYNYTGYDDFVPQRMDLSTAQAKLSSDQYAAPRAFADDVLLTFKNALAYPGTPLATRIAARYLELYFNTEFSIAFPGPNAALNKQLPWVAPGLGALEKVSAYDYGRLFGDPVNPLLFNLLDYYDRVPHPMDLSTVSRRLEAGLYDNLDNFLSAVDLVWSNCTLYHSELNPDLAAVALNCRSVFLDTFDKLSPGLRDHSALICDEIPVAESPAKPMAAPPKRTPPTPAVALIRRLKKMDQHKTFQMPVDEQLYPEYRNFVSTPMDLGTIERQLLEGYYKSVDAFIGDIRLVFSNCAAFNAEGTPVRVLGDRMAAFVESQLAEKMTTGHLQASLDEISSKLAAKRAAKELKEREKQLKAGPAKVAKPVPVATPTKPEGISLSKRVRTPQRPDVADDGAPVKQPKISALARRAGDGTKKAPAVPSGPEEPVFRTIPPRIPLPVSQRKRLMTYVRERIDSLVLERVHAEPSAMDVDEKSRSPRAVPFVPSAVQPFRLQLRQPRARHRFHRAPAFVTDDVDHVDVDGDGSWSKKVSQWLQKNAPPRQALQPGPVILDPTKLFVHGEHEASFAIRLDPSSMSVASVETLGFRRLSSSSSVWIRVRKTGDQLLDVFHAVLLARQPDRVVKVTVKVASLSDDCMLFSLPLNGNRREVHIPGHLKWVPDGFYMNRQSIGTHSPMTSIYIAGVKDSIAVHFDDFPVGGS
ncbi:unnamed protein product (mitochondrion) [Plasmodiophora brassicae]|uniref:Bromo domain-containing protein n=1 Tax=Plasmodiophora brassicae TaxID=37360 RepID=A0A3P3YFK5_PLABS|nr:unnamed protein product [Plasmodiophora brassicae]